MRGPWLRLAADGIEYRVDGKEEWNRMQRDEAWFILTALRGPDNGNDDAKVEFTARIRGLFCKWMDDKPQPLTDDDSYEPPPWMQRGALVNVPKAPEDMGTFFNANANGVRENHWAAHVGLATDAIEANCGWPKWE